MLVYNNWIRILKCILLVAFIKRSNARSVRSSGKANVPALIRAPSRLKESEATIPPPGWTHCVRNVIVSTTWRFIDTADFTNLQTTQFQCTWIIQSSRVQGAKYQKQIQISVQKLVLGTPNDVRCIRQFIEIIDGGKSQGRFCDRQVPGDYITLGSSIRIDVQGIEALANLVKSNRNPFVIAIKAVSKTEPGFRIASPTKVKDHEKEGNTKTGYYPSNYPGKKNDDDDEKSDGLSVGALVGIIVCCLLVAGFVLFVVIKKCCFAKEKTDKDKPRDREEVDSNIYPPPYSKAINLPRSSSHHTAASHHYGHFPRQIEVIITNETKEKRENTQNKTQNTKRKDDTKPSARRTLHKPPKQNKSNKVQEVVSHSKSPKINQRIQKQEGKKKKKVTKDARVPTKARPKSNGVQVSKSKNVSERKQQKRRGPNDDLPANRAPKQKSRKKKKKSLNNSTLVIGDTSMKLKNKSRPKSTNGERNQTKTKPHKPKPQSAEKKITQNKKSNQHNSQKHQKYTEKNFRKQ